MIKKHLAESICWLLENRERYIDLDVSMPKGLRTRLMGLRKDDLEYLERVISYLDDVADQELC